MERKRESKIKIDFPEGNKLMFLDKKDNVIAFCASCDTVVFIGSDKTQIGNRILRERVIEHIESFEKPHQIDIVYPRAATDRRIIDGEDFISPSITGFVTEYRNQ